MKNNIVVAMLCLAGVTAGCSVFTKQTDWTGRVCDSPIYEFMTGTYRGEIEVVNEAKSCKWNTTVVVTGKSIGKSCHLTGLVETSLVQQGSQGTDTYICAAGTSSAELVNGRSADDNLKSVAPTSLIFSFQPDNPTVDNNGVALIHPISELENLTADYEGLVSVNGVLRRQ